jgi:hypothetical protein
MIVHSLYLCTSSTTEAGIESAVLMGEVVAEDGHITVVP